MSIGTMQKFFHLFIERFVEELKERWIVYPKTAEEAKPNLDLYARMGFPGAVGELDCVHIHWVRCPAGLASGYNNGKNKYPSVVFEVATTHQRKIMHVTNGAPGVRSDKTIVKTDRFVQELRRKEILQDVRFELFDSFGTKLLREGAYLITDNGYLLYRCLQSPIKCALTQDEQYFSVRLESVRKGVECTFGILKARFRLLWSKILFQKQNYVNAAFLACCILHNMNVDDDGVELHAREVEDDDDLREGIELYRIRTRLCS